MTVFEMIEAQQKGKEDTAPWMVGEQLKDICRQDPGFPKWEWNGNIRGWAK